MLNDFRTYLRSKGRSENTIIAYGRDVSEFLKFLKSTGVGVQEVDHGTLLKFLAHLTEKKLSSSTRRRMMEAIKVFYRAMQKLGTLEEDPFQGFEDMPKVEDSNRRVLTEMEYRSLRDVVRGCRRKTSIRDFAILELALQTGLRRGEICSLITDDVEFSTRSTVGRVRVRKGKGGKERTVTLNDAAERALKEYMAVRPKDTGHREIFLNNQLRPCDPVIISRIFKKHMESAGIHDASFHSLRHTFATHSLRKGTNIRVVQEALGHKNLATTQKYLHFLQEMMDDQLTKNAL